MPVMIVKRSIRWCDAPRFKASKHNVLKMENSPVDALVDLLPALNASNIDAEFYWHEEEFIIIQLQPSADNDYEEAVIGLIWDFADNFEAQKIAQHLQAEDDKRNLVKQAIYEYLLTDPDMLIWLRQQPTVVACLKTGITAMGSDPEVFRLIEQQQLEKVQQGPRSS